MPRGLLIYAAVSSIRFGQIKLVWQSGINAGLALVVTFLATLFLPIAAAVGVGVLVSLLLQLNQGLGRSSSGRVAASGGRGVRGASGPHGHAPDRQVVVIDVYGSLLYAGARTLQTQSARPVGSDTAGRRPATSRPCVARRHVRCGRSPTTSARLDRVGGHLILAGVQSPALTKIERTVMARAAGAVEVFEASTVIGESTNLAIDAGLRWLDEHPPAAAADTDPHGLKTTTAPRPTNRRT